MKILCLSDQVDPLVHSTSAKSRFSDVSLVLGAGDLPMEYLGFVSATLNQRILFVFGNHNLKHVGLFRRRAVAPVGTTEINYEIRNSFGAELVSDRTIRVDDVIVAGLGGSMRYNDGSNQFSEFQMFLRVVRLVPRLWWNRLVHGRYLDILLTHAPPYRIHDKSDPCHTGFRSFLWLMRTFKPRYLLHGHVHLYDRNAERVTRYHNTEVINVFSHYLLDTEQEA